jgi:hypothetical protein
LPPTTLNELAHGPTETQDSAPIRRRGARVTPTRRTIPREPTREPVRSAGVVTALGRDGEVLSRKRTSVGDIFHIPRELIPEGWDFQWIPVSVTGNTEIVLDQQLMMMENGWRPIMADRFPGRFMPPGHKGQIIRGGQGLYERPMSLTLEARAEDIRNAKQLISDRNESFKMTGLKKNMPDGFEMSNRYRQAGGNIRLQIDPGLDIPSPQHQLASTDD